MQKKVDKYIYIISENNYRIKFSKVANKKGINFQYDKCFNCTLDEVIKIRDKELEKI